MRMHGFDGFSSRSQEIRGELNELAFRERLRA
jgi:hypothetical protein